MCGIGGLLALDGAPFVGARDAARMAGAMRRRGPDGEGYLAAWADGTPPRPFAGSDTPPSTPAAGFQRPLPLAQAQDVSAHLWLAHRRLAILDLSPRAHQPMGSRDGRHWMVFNGEIYNFRALARTLAERGVAPASSGDTEVLLLAYQEWGLAMLDRLHGMFACAIWDDVEKTLFCARDRLGIKPLYYQSDERRFRFGSDIKSIIAGGYRPTVHREGLYHALAVGVAPRPMTAFDGVHGLEPGHWLRIGPDGSERRRCWWRVTTDAQDRTMSAGDAADQLEATLQQSVESRMVADVPVGTLMSAGIDSTTVTAMAAEAMPGIRAFTLGFHGAPKDRDEIRLARRVAQHIGVEHVTERVAADGAIEQLDAIVRCYEEPAITLAPPFMVTNLVARHACPVVLTGLGGDELFAGYPRYRQAARWRGPRISDGFARMVRAVVPATMSWPERWSAVSADRLYATTHARMTQATLRRLFGNHAQHEYDSPERLHALYVGDDRTFSDPIEAFCYMDTVHYVGNHHLYRSDQFGMHFGIEARFPMLDHRVVELAFRMPSRLKWHDGRGKRVLREVAARWIPPEVVAAPKRGFSMPLASWLRGPLRPMAERHIDDLAERGILDPDAIRTHWRSFLEGRARPSGAWLLVATELWLSAFFDADATDSPTLGF